MRLTGYAHGGGCACKIPPGELEEMVAGLSGLVDPSVLVGLVEFERTAGDVVAGEAVERVVDLVVEQSHSEQVLVEGGVLSDQAGTVG